MAKSISHAVSTRVTNISQRAEIPRADIGRGLMQHIMRILTCIVHFIIYYIWRIHDKPFFTQLFDTAWATELIWIVHFIIYFYSNQHMILIFFYVNKIFQLYTFNWYWLWVYLISYSRNMCTLNKISTFWW